MTRAPTPRWARRAGIAWTVALGLGLAAPVGLTALVALAGTAGAGAPDSLLALWSASLWRSAQVVGVVVPLALLIGGPAAWSFRRHPFPGSRLLEAAVLVPLAVPGVALAFGLLLSAGALPRFWLLAAAHLAYTVPLVVTMVGNAVDRLDPRLEAAARSLGAGRGEALRAVVLPLLAPAVALSSLLVFAVSWGELNASFFLSTPLVRTFPAALYTTYGTSSFPVAAAATLVCLLPVVPAMLAIQALGGEDLHPFHAFHRGLQP